MNSVFNTCLDNEHTDPIVNPERICNPRLGTEYFVITLFGNFIVQWCRHNLARRNIELFLLTKSSSAEKAFYMETIAQLPEGIILVGESHKTTAIAEPLVSEQEPDLESVSPRANIDSFTAHLEDLQSRFKRQEPSDL
jgi:hypothetical protein